MIPAKPSADGLSFLYVVQSLHAVKIGFAQNLYLRMSNFRADNPHDVKLIAFWEVPGADAYQIEQHAHYLLKREPISGEWFAVTPEEARDAAERAIKRVAETEAQRAAKGGAPWRDLVATGRRLGMRTRDVIRMLEDPESAQSRQARGAT